MLVAPNQAPAPVWSDVLGAGFLFDPITRTMLIRARRAGREVSQAQAEEALAGGEAMPPLELIEELGDAVSRVLITLGLKDWRDVFVAALDDAGEPILDRAGDPVFDLLPFSPENVTILLADPVIFEALDAAYVVPFIVRERERAAPGNVFAASPSGTGEVAMQASDTVSSPAPPAARAAGPAVKRARTSSKTRKPQKKRTSGAS